jgi:hypothetical protein
MYMCSVRVVYYMYMCSVRVVYYMYMCSVRLVYYMYMCSVRVLRKGGGLQLTVSVVGDVVKHGPRSIIQ